MKPALCELVDQQDGRFLLRIRPQEPGCHQLSVTFCGEPILGQFVRPPTGCHVIE